MNETNYTLFMESRTAAADSRNHYRIMTELAPGASCVYLNQFSRDEALRELLTDRRFRIALSLAINREELIALCFHGLAITQLSQVLRRRGFHGRRIVTATPRSFVKTGLLELPMNSANISMAQLGRMEMSRIHHMPPRCSTCLSSVISKLSRWMSRRARWRGDALRVSNLTRA
jgi:hypothetical protein